MNETDETSSRRPNLMRVALVVFALWILAAIGSSRCLYADGTHEFIQTLWAQNFVAFMWSRHFAFYIFEFPLVMAIKLGVTNMTLLRMAFGLGCFLPWPVVLWCCHRISPKHSWLAIAGCAAGYLNACYMAVGEHILAHAFFWSSLFAILFARPLKPLAMVILLGSASGLLFSYESQLFLCLPLAALSFWRIGEETGERDRSSSQKTIWSRAVLAAAGALFLIGAGVGLHAILKPELPNNLMGFRANVQAMLGSKGWTMTWTMAWGCLMLAVWLSDKTWEIIRRPWAIAILVLALALWGFAPVLSPGTLEPARQYNNRVLDLLVPLLLLPIALILRYRPEWIASKSARLTQMTAILLLVQSLWQLGATWQWQRDVATLQNVLSSHTGIVVLQSTTLATCSMESRKNEFDWTWPCLSIALNPTRHIQCLVGSWYYIDPTNEGRHWEPFDSLKPDTLPKLEHYNLDFTLYIAALAGEAGGK